jgi:hypothetical protein
LSIKKGIIATGLAGSLVLGGSLSAFAATDYDLTQSYADSIKGDSYQSVVDTLGEPDNREEVEVDGVGTIISATWTAEDYDMLTVSTSVDGETIENVIFGSAGDLEDYSTVDADLEGAYTNIQSGMSYNDVVEVVGAEGTEGASSEASFGDEITATSSVYTWSTDDFSILSVAFSNDEMIAKTMVTSSGEVLMDYADEEIVAEDPTEETGDNEESGDTTDSTNVEEESSEDTTESTSDEEESLTDTTGSSNSTEESNGEMTTEEESATNEDASNEEATTEKTTSSDEQGGKLPDTNAGIPMGLLAGLGATIVGAFGLRRKK